MSKLLDLLQKILPENSKLLESLKNRKKRVINFKEPTQQKREHKRKGFTHNHGKGKTKKRRKMAKESRRINRKFS